MTDEGIAATMAFGIWFDLELDERGWSPAEFSRRSGIYASTISKWRNGMYLPKKPQMETIAETFGIPVSAVEAATGRGPGFRDASVAQREAHSAIQRIPDDLLPLGLLWLELLSDQRRWSRIRTAILEAQRFLDDMEAGPQNGPEPEDTGESSESDVSERAERKLSEPATKSGHS